MNRRFVPALAIALAHAAIILVLGVQAAIDRDRLPRAWAQATPTSQWSRAHGRYLTVNLTPLTEPGLSPRLDVVNQRTVSRPTPITLEARDGRLIAHRAAANHVYLLRAQPREDAPPMIAERVDCFIASGARDDLMPMLQRGELWVEVSVPRQGPPRPLRLGKMIEGKVVPLADVR